LLFWRPEKLAKKATNDDLVSRRPQRKLPLLLSVNSLASVVRVANQPYWQAGRRAILVMEGRFPHALLPKMLDAIPGTN
jgi:hypothetical protein